MTCRERIRIRQATRHDLEGLVSVVSNMDLTSLLLPLTRGSLSTEQFFRRQFRAPYGTGGYRLTTVLELDGVIGAFVIAMPLQDAGDALVDVLPLATLKERYGDDLSGVLHISLIAVKSELQRLGLATRVGSWAVRNAAEQGYRYVMGQARKDTRVSVDGMMNYGFRLFHEVDVQIDSTQQRVQFFDFDCRQLSVESSL